MKCANCEQASHYVHTIAKGHAVHYCSRHVPAFLEPRKKANRLPTTDEWAKDNAEAIAILSVNTDKKPSALEEVEGRIDTIVEKTEEELKKIRKKAAPKKAE